MMSTKSQIVIFFIFSILFLVLISLSSYIKEWHDDGTIYWISSDAPVYYAALEEFPLKTFFENIDYFKNLLIVFNVNLIGNITSYLLITMIICYFIIKYSLNYINARYRILYIFLLMIFPYANIAFYSINKEIFAFYSIILFSCYYLNKSWKILLIALLLSLFARSYIALCLISMLFIFPVRYKPRWYLLFIYMIFISLLPFFLGETQGFENSLLDQENAGASAVLFSSLIREGLFVFIYPFKYLIMMSSKFYQLFNVGFDFGARPQDLHEGIVSLLTIILFVISIYIYIFRRKYADSRFFYLALFSPALLQFSDIFHWRYSAFVYVFYVFYIMSYKNGLNYFTNIKKKRYFYE